MKKHYGSFVSEFQRASLAKEIHRSVVVPKNKKFTTRREMSTGTTCVQLCSAAC